METKSLLSLMVIGIAALGIGIGTLASFSDVETSTGNTFTSGTMNLQVSDADPLVDKFTVTNAYPGYSGFDDWLLKNTGSIDGSLDVTFSNLVDADNGINEAESGATGEDGTENGELAEVLALVIYIDENHNDVNDAGDTVIYTGMASGIIGEKLTNYAMVANYGSDGNKAVRIEWSIASDVNNKIQSDRAGFDITFELLETAD